MEAKSYQAFGMDTGLYLEAIRETARRVRHAVEEIDDAR